MKKVWFFIILCSVLNADMMSGWSNSAEIEEIKARKAEQKRMCRLYIDKVKKYKETMRDDELAQATLNNYVRLQTKYCKKVDTNTSK